MGAAKVFEAYKFPPTYRSVPEGAVVLTPTLPDKPTIDETFVVVTLPAVTLRLGAARVFEAYKLPSTYRLVPDVVLVPTPIPTSISRTFATVVAFAVGVRIVGVLRAFEAYRLPWTYKRVPDGSLVPIPTLLFGEKIEETLVVVILAVMASNSEVPRAFDAYKLP